MAKAKSDPPGSVDGYKHGRVPREVRRGQLLELAEQLFMEKGYGGFSIDDLCRAAGVSRPIVYEHFGSKDGIYLACLRRIRAEFEAALVAAAVEGGADLQETVKRSSEVWFEMIERSPQRWSLVYGGATGLVGPLADQLAELRNETVDQIGAVLTRYAPGVDPRQIKMWAHSVSGAGEQLGRWWLQNKRVRRAKVVDFYGDFIYAAATHLIDAQAVLDET